MRSVIPAALLLLAFRLEAGNCGTQYFHLHLIGDAKLNGIALDAPQSCRTNRRW